MLSGSTNVIANYRHQTQAHLASVNKIGIYVGRGQDRSRGFFGDIQVIELSGICDDRVVDGFSQGVSYTNLTVKGGNLPVGSFDYGKKAN